MCPHQTTGHAVDIVRLPAKESRPTFIFINEIVVMDRDFIGNHLTLQYLYSFCCFYLYCDNVLHSFWLMDQANVVLPTLLDGTNCPCVCDDFDGCRRCPNGTRHPGCKGGKNLNYIIYKKLSKTIIQYTE